MARSRAARASRPRWSRIVSTIWFPTVWTGLNEVIGSWKTSPISPPRIWRISRPSGSSCATSTVASGCPSPAGAGAGSPRSRSGPGRSTMRRIDRAVTLFPQPLSPTMPRVRPAWSSKLAPSTALTVPSSAKKYVRRSRTSRIGVRL